MTIERSNASRATSCRTTCDTGRAKFFSRHVQRRFALQSESASLVQLELSTARVVAPMSLRRRRAAVNQRLLKRNAEGAGWLFGCLASSGGGSKAQFALLTGLPAHHAAGLDPSNRASFTRSPTPCPNGYLASLRGRVGRTLLKEARVEKLGSPSVGIGKKLPTFEPRAPAESPEVSTVCG